MGREQSGMELAETHHREDAASSGSYVSKPIFINDVLANIIIIYLLRHKRSTGEHKDTKHVKSYTIKLH